MQICVVGLGYIGLPTASILATHGVKVVGVDIQPEIIRGLEHGRSAIEEPGLETLVQAALKSGQLRPGGTVEPSDIFMICVPTPLDRVSKKADLAFVVNAAESIAPHLKSGNLIILESTVPPGTTQDILCPILARSGLEPGRDLHIAHCPERVLPGRILHELVSNDRVIGGLNPESARRAEALYRQFVQGGIFLTDCKTAETVKLVENTFRDLNIAFANEVDAICRRLKIDVWEVIRLANKHPRVKLLAPGVGVGGHCIAIDPWFLAQAAPDEARLTSLAREINDDRPSLVIRTIDQGIKKTGLVRPKLTLLGATYKADVDDTRESPAVKIIRHFMAVPEVDLAVADPHAGKLDVDVPLFGLEEAIDRADVIALLVDHKEFLRLDWASIVSKKGLGRILDFKGALGNLRPPPVSSGIGSV